MQSQEERSVLQSSLRKTCQVLSETPELQWLHITLLRYDGFIPPPRVLEPFTSLKNVRSVTFKGVRPRYAQHLKTLVEGSDSRDQIGQMYHNLCKYAGPFDFCEDELDKAHCAMKNGDGKMFRHFRKIVVEKVEKEMAFAKEHLYDFDKDFQGNIGRESSAESVAEVVDEMETEVEDEAEADSEDEAETDSEDEAEMDSEDEVEIESKVD